MSPTSTLSVPTVSRPDMDIAADVVLVIRDYPPLHVSHDYMQTEIHDGKVTLRGNVRSIPGLRYLQNEIPRIDGVTGLNLDQLFDDEAVRLNVAENLPEGLYVNVQFGTVTLNGIPAADLDQQALIETIQSVPGVRRVLAQFDAINTVVK